MPNTQPKNWAVGHNMPGYLPEADVYITSDWASARDALVADLERASEDDYEADNELSEIASKLMELRDAAQNKRMELNPNLGTSETWTGETGYWVGAHDAYVKAVELLTHDEYDDAIAELRKLAANAEYDDTIGNTAWWLNATTEAPSDDS